MPNGLPYPMVNTGTAPFDQTGDNGQTPFSKANWALTNLVQSPGEIAAGVTPTNWGFAPGCVDRYFTNDDPGNVSAVQAFNTAITVALMSPGSVAVTYGFTGCYLLDSPINGTWGGNVGGAYEPNLYSPGLTIINLGSVGYDGANTNTPFSGLYAKHTGPAVFDFTGTDYVTLINPVITTHTSTFPKVGILGSRAVTPLPGGGTQNSGGVIRIRGGRIIGHFSVACYYNYGIEIDAISQCDIYNYSTGANTKALCVTGNNISNVETSFSTDAVGQPLTQSTGAQSCTIHEYTACAFANFSGQTTSDAIYIEASDSVTVSGWAYSGVTGRANVYFDSTHSGSAYFDCTNLSDESYSALYGIMYGDENPQTYTYHRLNPRKLIGQNASIYSQNVSTILNNFTIGNTHDPTSGTGVEIAGTLAFSTCDSGYILTLGMSEQNLLIGDPTEWYIGPGGSTRGRNKDRWISRTASTTFAPDIATGVNGWTVSGLTQSGFFEFIERSVKFKIILSGTSIAWGANATIPTLPGTALASMASICTVADTATGSILSAGVVTAGTYALSFPFGNSILTLPAAHSASSDTIIIQGEYFVA